jgi:enterochelin esterase family protein
VKRFVFFLLLMATSSWGQSSQPLEPVVSPEVLSDNRVIFRFRAPNAKEVLLTREGAKRVPMEKNAQGVWIVTTIRWSRTITDTTE